MIISSVSIFGQKQLSFIDNQVPTVKYLGAGLVNIDSTEYLIELNPWSLRVSTVKDSVEILYEVSDFPLDDELSYWYGRMNTRSGYVVDGIYFYEIFRKQIRKRNLLTSEIVDVYSFPNYESESFRNMEIVGNLIHFETGEDCFISYFNTTTNEYKSLSITSKSAFRDGNYYYYKEKDWGIIEYNAQDGIKDTLFETEHSAFFGTNSKLNGQNGLVFGGFYNARFLNRDTSFLLGCEFLDPIEFDFNVHETEEYYIAILNNCNRITIQVKNKVDCFNYLSESFELECGSNQSIEVFDSPVFNKDYILFANNHNSWFDYSELFLFDKNELKISQFANNTILYINEDSFYKSGNEIYFIGQEAIFDHSEMTLFSIDLNTKQLKTQQEALPYVNPLSFGSSENDSTLFIGRNSQSIPSIYKFYNGSNVNKFYTATDTKNEGLNPIRYLAIDEEKIVFKFNNGIYLADNNSNDIDKATKIFDAKYISDLVINNGGLKGLMGYSIDSYILNYEINNDLLTTTPLEEYMALDASSLSLSNVIFGKFSILKKLYWDIETETFIPIPISDNIISIHKSNENILILNECSENYCLTSYKNGQFKDITKTYQNKPEVFSKKNGQFLILESISEHDKELSIINIDGSIGGQIIIHGTKVTNDQNGIENGPLAAMMFFNSEATNLEIILHRYNDFHSFIIPFSVTEWTRISWHKAGNSIVVKSNAYNEKCIYVCTIGKDLKKLDLNNTGSQNHNLLFASYQEGAISLIVDSSFDNTEFVNYYIESDSLSITQSNYNDLVYHTYFNSSKFQISPNKFFVTFNHNSIINTWENNEPYLFDTENLTLQSLPDLNKINLPSNPHRFIESSTHLYFIARSPQDNSYQLFSIQKEEITSVHSPNNYKSKVKITPNPSSNFISIGIDADELKCYDSKGIEVMTINRYSANQKIDISDLNIGVYFLITNANNKMSTNKFIKI